jgi:hypothetical protein
MDDSHPDSSARGMDYLGELSAAESAAERLDRNGVGHVRLSTYEVSVPDFPLAVLPTKMRAFVESAGASIGCPPEFVAVPVLALAEGTAGKSRRLVIRPGFEVSPGSWFGVVAESGTGKSPGQKYAMRLVAPLQEEAWEMYRQRLEAWQAMPKDQRGERPTPEHFCVTDSTGEALWATVASSPGVTLVEDELRRRLKALDAYRQGGDRQAMLSLWSNAPVTIVRRTSEPIFIPFPVAPLVGGIQPGVLRHLSGEGADADADDGWVPRFQLTWPDAAPLALSETPFDPKTLTPAVEIFRALRLYRPEAHDTMLSPKAFADFKAWHSDNRRAQLASRGLERQWAAKAPIHLARHALTLHLFAWPIEQRELSSETMEAAIELVEYFRAHLTRVLPAFGLAVTASVQSRIFRILRRAEAEYGDGWANRSAILDGLRNVTSADLTEVLERLLAAGIVERRIVPGVTKSTEQWRLTPMHTAFGASEYSDNPGAEERNTEYSEYPNGHTEEFPDRVLGEEIVR